MTPATRINVSSPRSEAARDVSCATEKRGRFGALGIAGFVRSPQKRSPIRDASEREEHKSVSEVYCATPDQGSRVTVPFEMASEWRFLVHGIWSADMIGPVAVFRLLAQVRLLAMSGKTVRVVTRGAARTRWVSLGRVNAYDPLSI
ncbi:hypothetical protein AA23498_2509 [Acetobacter nitrogenifigens DSM 23921 = NBRC 105050]|uniref:Uncharacterized protein n=1 Tax=Acetobacter nitrogenifigens DSM 23921 = NBRC 105050 TaxID=1120919 RepID=A0A511X6A4_9PROT|nr:hypothetical protein AA23498_2509 [Acetobacter nitrogenifigens DSM 23921 = NBRC 105050]GEN58474.1 hypothetical protein ANI02nite_03580 [Acetobacter nitrogenifigens DSM 23921 = NBRC 105050]